MGLGGEERVGLLGPATAAGGRGDAELVRVGGDGLVSRSALRGPSKGDLEGSGKLGMVDMRGLNEVGEVRMKMDGFGGRGR